MRECAIPLQGMDELLELQCCVTAGLRTTTIFMQKLQEKKSGEITQRESEAEA